MPPPRIILIAGPAASGKSTLLEAIRNGECPRLYHQININDHSQWSYVSLRDIVKFDLEKTTDSFVVHCDLNNRDTLMRIRILADAAEHTTALTLCLPHSLLLQRHWRRARCWIPKLFRAETRPLAMQKLRSFKIRQKRNKNLTDLRALYHRYFDLLDEHKASTYWIDSSSLKNPSALPLNNDRQPVLNLLQRPASTSTFPSIGKQIQNFSKHWKKQARPNAVRSKGWKTKPAQDAICVLPWMHLHVQETGRIKLCCASKNSLPLGNAKTDRLTERFNSPQMQKVRDQMTRGIIPPECKSCFKNERTGSVSLRQFYNGTFSTLVEQIRAGEQKPELRALDLRISNACNLKCRSCSSASSSAWFSDQQALYPDRPTDRLVTLEESEPFNIQLSALLDRGLDELHLAGGEPLITDFNYRLLDRLIESGRTNTSLYYDTNLNTLTHNGRDILKLWNHFSSLHISLSLDATGAQGEYIRHGLDFERWKTNLHRLKKEVPHASLRLHIVVSVFNIATLPKHLERICAEPFVQPKRIGFTFLIGPPHLCVQILPKHLKKNIARNLRRNIVNNPAYSPNLRTATNNLIRFMNAKDRTEELDEFRRITSTLDQRRNENAWDLFPELRDILAAPESG